MAASQVLARLRRLREKTVDLGDGRKVKFLRPPEADYGRMLIPDPADPSKATWRVGIEDVKRCVIDWEGFTEASILGESVGSADAVPFDPDLFAELVTDQIEWVTKVANAILESVVENIEHRNAEAKNLLPAST